MPQYERFVNYGSIEELIEALNSALSQSAADRTRLQREFKQAVLALRTPPLLGSSVNQALAQLNTPLVSYPSQTLTLSAAEQTLTVPAGATKATIRWVSGRALGDVWSLSSPRVFDGEDDTVTLRDDQLLRWRAKGDPDGVLRVEYSSGGDLVYPLSEPMRRKVVSVTTPSIPARDSVLVSVPLGSGFTVYAVTASVASRVRLYSYENGALIDVDRPTTQRPELVSGLILDVLTAVDQLRVDLLPPFARGASRDGGPNITCRITSDVPYATAITVDFEIVPEEL